MGRLGGATLGPFAFGDAIGFGGVTMTWDGRYGGGCGVFTLRKVGNKRIESKMQE